MFFFLPFWKLKKNFSFSQICQISPKLPRYYSIFFSISTLFCIKYVQIFLKFHQRYIKGILKPAIHLSFFAFHCILQNISWNIWRKALHLSQVRPNSYFVDSWNSARNMQNDWSKLKIFCVPLPPSQTYFNSPYQLFSAPS